MDGFADHHLAPSLNTANLGAVPDVKVVWASPRGVETHTINSLGHEEKFCVYFGIAQGPLQCTVFIAHFLTILRVCTVLHDNSSCVHRVA